VWHSWQTSWRIDTWFADRAKVTYQEVMSSLCVPTVLRITDKSLRAIHSGAMPWSTWTSDPSADTRGATDRNERCSWRLWNRGKPTDVTAGRTTEGTFRYALSFISPSPWFVVVGSVNCDVPGYRIESVVAPLPFVCWPWIRDRRQQCVCLGFGSCPVRILPWTPIISTEPAVAPGKCWGSTLNQATIASCLILSSSLFTVMQAFGAK
jgi:hypothetical protein